ncbi:MAG: DUF6067 family protein [Clostridia bacterium]|nr:DUF6067 family protein [Clostridia bacterium]
MKIYAIDRKKVIKNNYDINELADAPCGRSFAYTISRYQYFVAQLVVVSNFNEEVEVITSPLTGEGQELARAVSCLNTAGIDAFGRFFFRKIKLTAGKMQPILIGFNLSEAKLGTFTTHVSIGGIKVKLTLHLNDELVFNDGADDIFSGGRLKWLNSDLGRKSVPVKGYNPLALEGNKLLFTGKEALIGNDGLLEDVVSFFTSSNHLSSEPQNNLFYQPMRFEVEGQRYRYSKQRVSGRGALISYSAEGRGDTTRTEVSATAKYEGTIDYKINIVAEKDTIIDNISLNFYFSACTFIMGLGKKGGYYEPIEYQWDNTKQQDAIFVGDINCGARVRFKDKRDERPFEAEYYGYKPFRLPNNSWENHGNGKIILTKTDAGAALSATTGRMVLPAGASVRFDFELHITPFKPIDLKKQFTYRTISLQKDGNLEKQLERASWHQNNTLAIGWPNSVYKHINYPFSSVSDIKNAVMVSQSKGFSTTLDYSLWHTSSANPELNMLKSFGDEFIYRAEYNFSDCLSRRLGEGAVEAVRAIDENDDISDMSVLLQTDSRLENYFVEAVNYIYSNFRVDGINIQGAHISRSVAERIKRVSDDCRAAIGISLTESDNFKQEKALASSLNLHTPILPFIDRLTVDDSYAVCDKEEYMLTEVSGLLYGVTAEAASPLFDPIESLLYGIVLRGGMCTEKKEVLLESLYGVCKDFDMGNSRMYGYWDKTNPVSTDNAEVKLTSYINNESLLAVVYNKSAKGVEFDIGINPKLGFTSKDKQIIAPLIIGMQNKRIINFNKTFYLKGKSGLLILVK